MCVANTMQQAQQPAPIMSDDESDLDVRECPALQSWPSPKEVPGSHQIGGFVCCAI